ncbi:MAG: glycosyltransferase [Flavobacteriaceae bacterium]|nr:glycosyltransferase [Flavobacteriaceae bacterium]
MKKIRILHILHAVGGVEVSLRLILANTNPDEFEHFVIHGRNEVSSTFFDKNNEKITTFKSSIVRDIQLFKDLSALKEINQLIDQIKPDLIHAHSTKGGVFGKVVAKNNNLKCLHTPQAFSYLSTNNKLKKKAFLFIERLLSKLNNKILASSKSEMNRAINEVGYPISRVLLFSNSINSVHIPQDYSLSIKKTWPDKYICSVGRPSYQKNIELMIEGLYEVKKTQPNIHLILMGVGLYSPNLEQVKRLISKYNLKENVTLLEWTKREDVFKIVSDADLYVSTARYEGLPYSIIEALALKKAVIATDSDGNRDLVKDNVNGYLIKPEPKEFAMKTLELLTNNELRKKFEKASFLRFNEEFNIQKTITNLEVLYKEEILS